LKQRVYFVPSVMGAAVIILCFFMFSAAYAGENNAEKNRERIKNSKIKEQIQYTYILSKKDDSGFVSCKKMFDRNGNLLREAWFGSDKLMFSDLNCMYDNDGNCTEETRYSRKDKFTRYVYKYNQMKLKTDIEIFKDNGYAEKRSFLYDKEGRLIENFITRPDNDYDKFSYIYDEKGNQIKVVCVRKSEPAGYYSFTYDTCNNKIMDLCFGADGSAVTRIIRKFDSTGLKTEEIQYKGTNEFALKRIFSYDTNKFLTSEIDVDTTDKILLELKYVNNPEGQHLEETSINEKGITNIHRVIRYDSKGNITEEVYYNTEGKPDKTIKYRYEYYN